MGYRLLLMLLFCFMVFTAQAQFQVVYIGVNGLTCSQCSRTVEMSIRKLDFVGDVQMNLQHTEGKITLRKDKNAEMDKVAKAITDAGFSVRYLHADLAVDESFALNSSCYVYKGDGYVFATPPGAGLKGTVKLKFIGKLYMPKSELKKIPAFKDGQCKVSGKTYHVAL